MAVESRTHVEDGSNNNLARRLRALLPFTDIAAKQRAGQTSLHIYRVRRDAGTVYYLLTAPLIIPHINQPANRLPSYTPNSVTVRHMAIVIVLTSTRELTIIIAPSIKAATRNAKRVVFLRCNKNHCKKCTALDWTWAGHRHSHAAGHRGGYHMVQHDSVRTVHSLLQSILYRADDTAIPVRVGVQTTQSAVGET